jgi:HUS1 checkpoint protein
MSDTSRPVRRRPRFHLGGLLRLPLLPAIATKRLVSFTYISFIAFIMGQSVHEEPEIKKHTAGSPATTHASAVHIEDKTDQTCPICQEPTGTRNLEGIEEGWSMLPCGHRFGSYCIKRYLGIAADDQPLCPICRQIAYHDPCGHPVLPFALAPCGTHPDLVTDSTGMLRPPTGVEALMTVACEYCKMVDERRKDPANKKSALLSILKVPFRWLRAFIPAVIRNAVQRAVLTLESSSDQENRLTRQEVRTRRRNPLNSGPWHGPWMDVQSRDEEWEKWWKDQPPREA